MNQITDTIPELNKSVDFHASTDAMHVGRNFHTLGSFWSKNMSKKMVISERFELDYKDRVLLLYEQFSTYFR